MSVTIPRAVMTEIRELIYQRLDDANYLAQGRAENGKFMEQLAHDPVIGGRIAEYTGRERVKTYIKDSVINRYTKEKTKPPSDLSTTVAGIVGEKVSRVDGGRDKGISLYGGGRTLVVVSCGRLLKWETALRKLLEYMVRNRGRLEHNGVQHLVLMLVLMTGGKRIPSADRELLERSLEAIQIKVSLL